MTEIAIPDQEPSQTQVPWALFSSLLVASFALLVGYGWLSGSWLVFVVLALLAVSALVVGALAGFVFGIPRSIEVTEDAAASRSGFRPSTNLEQVSDWLTKILIGVGLVELTDIGDALGRLGRLVAEHLQPDGPLAVVVPGMVVGFAVLGFLPSYLWTCLDFYDLLTIKKKAIDDRFQQLQTKVNQQLADQDAKTETARKVAEASLTTSASLRKRHYVKIEEMLARWSDDLRGKVQTFLNAPPDWDSDTAREIFGDAAAQTTSRRLTVSMVASVGQLVVLSARVESIDGSDLKNPVAFLLHPTFPERVISVQPQDAHSAELELYAEGWFTLYAIADQGEVLAVDLRQVEGVPATFKKS